MRTWRLASPILRSAALLALSACGGGGGAAPAAPALTAPISLAQPVAPTPAATATAGVPHTAATPSTTTTLQTRVQAVIVIAPPADAVAQAAARKASAFRHAAFVSPGTNGVQLTISQGATQVASSVADVSSGSSLCTTTNGGRTCTIPLNVQSGTYTFALTSFNESPSSGAIPGTAQELGTASALATVLAGQTNQINFYIGAVVSSVGIGSQGNSSAYSSLPADGNVHTYAVSLLPTDASGNPISGSVSTLANPVSVALAEGGGSGHAHLVYNGTASGESVTLTRAGDSLSITYDGGGSAGYSMTITFTASGAPASTLTISPMFVSGDSKFSGGQVLFTALGQNEPFAITERNAPGTVTYVSSGAVCPALPSGSNPQLASQLTGSISGSGGSATMTVTANMTPASPTGCVVTIADSVGTAITVPITLATGTPAASSVAANVQIDPSHFSSGTPAALAVTQGGNPVTSLTLRQSSGPVSVTVAENDDVSAPTVTPTGCSGIVTVASSLTQGTWSATAMGSLSGSLVLFPTNGGTCTVQIADGNGQSATITITALVSGAMTQYGPLAATPHSITVGSDGNIWVLEPPKVAKIDPATGAAVEYTPGFSSGAYSNNWDITNGPDGNLWVSEISQLAKVSTSGSLLAEYSESARALDTIISGSDGNLWATTEFTYIERISPSNGSTTAAYSWAPGDYANGLTLDGAGNLWAGNSVFNQGSPFIVRQTMSGSTNTYQITSISELSGNLDGPIGGEFEVGCPYRSERPITYGSDGNVWMLSASYGAGCPSGNYYLTKITPGLSFTSYTEPGVLTTIANGSDGNLWAGGQFNGAGAIERITPSGAPTIYNQTTAGGSLNGLPIGIVPGPDGNLWFVTNNGYYGKMSP